MINWKVVVGSGVVAGVLSLLTGIISGVSFGTLLLRALMWGAIFCGVGGSVSFVIAKYLPELFSSPAEGERDEAETRRNVDIVLPDENPHRGGQEYESEEPSYEVEDARDIEEPRAPRPETTHTNNLIEEVEEIPRDAVPPSVRRSAPAHDAEGPVSDEDLPNFEPDESGLSSLGESSEFEADEIPGVADISQRGQRIEVLGHQADPEEIARAICTTLKKDQKG